MACGPGYKVQAPIEIDWFIHSAAASLFVTSNSQPQYIIPRVPPLGVKSATTPYNHGCEIALPPPIPEDLEGRACFYGFVINDELFAQYDKEHQPEPLPVDNYTNRSNQRAHVLAKFSKELGFFMLTRVFPTTLDTPDGDIVQMLALASHRHRGTKYWYCPAPEVLDEFRRRLMTDVQPKWIATRPDQALDYLNVYQSAQYAELSNDYFLWEAPIVFIEVRHSFLPTTMAAIASEPTPLELKVATTPYKHGCKVAPPPPIPAELQGRRCYYGFVINDELCAQYDKEHHLERLPTDDYTNYSNRRANIMAKFSKELGFFLWTLDVPTIVDSPEGDMVNMLALASYHHLGTKYWYCPSPKVLDEFCRRLMTDVQPTWIATRSI
ncbi:hypothetical protein FA95DRAFT_1608480 [Auriscalpium vulgare]|uniref:Uncharacterized protein n=1 Tax=Auriscalpium vulgare TaxID=40419 RepID=A0ACB8RLA2_9AGAM|nr:hypothetical protein FA95DRAFT_1608480 [Auriscalpium vulgare]